jgi:peroxiredoxin
MALKAGDKAPDFSLYNTEKKLVGLSDYAGDKNILLLFFPLAFTSVCTKELCAVRDDINKYNTLDTVVLGVSVDSVYTLARYREEQSYNFPLLSDFNKEVSRLYETMHSSFGNMGMLGVSKRSAFIIDKEGILRYVEVLENPGEIPQFEKIAEVLEELNQHTKQDIL